jgi:molybdenum cofactor cytidylyltransferase
MRLEWFEMNLAETRTVPHDVAALAQALAVSTGEVLFVLTGSATSDIMDTAPQSLRAAGGRVHHYGMPVEPGNLLFLVDLQGKPVIGLPGCALACVEWC